LDEDRGFWLLSAIIEDVCTGYYDRQLSGLRVDIEVAEELVETNLPRLATHLRENGVLLDSLLVELMMTIGENFTHALYSIPTLPTPSPHVYSSSFPSTPPSPHTPPPVRPSPLPQGFLPCAVGLSPALPLP
jgi:hypothetical protein